MWSADWQMRVEKRHGKVNLQAIQPFRIKDYKDYKELRANTPDE